MKTIYKYELISDETTLTLPRYSTILSAGEQDGKIVVWVLIDKDETREEAYQIKVIGTGWDIKNPYDQSSVFLNTVQMKNGLVFHVFLVYKA